MISEKGIEHLSLISPSIKENTSILNEIRSIARQTKSIYAELLLEEKRKTALLERLEKAGKVVTIAR